MERKEGKAVRAERTQEGQEGGGGKEGGKRKGSNDVRIPLQNP